MIIENKITNTFFIEHYSKIYLLNEKVFIIKTNYIYIFDFYKITNDFNIVKLSQFKYDYDLPATQETYFEDFNQKELM